MKKIKNYTLSLLLLMSLSGVSSVANAGFYSETLTIPEEDIQLLTNIVNKLKNGNFDEYTKEFCNTNSKLLAKNIFDEYCKTTFKDAVAVADFKINLENEEKNGVIKVNKVSTYKSLGLMYGIFYNNIQRNLRFEHFIEEKDEEYKSKEVTEDVKAKLIKEIDAFIDSEKMNATNDEYKKYKEILKQLEDMRKDVEKYELKTEVQIKDLYFKKNMKIISSEQYEKIFKSNYGKEKINALNKEIERLLKSKSNLDMYYKIMLSKRINKIMLNLQNKQENILQMKECEFLRDMEILSKEGLNTLVCKK